MEITERISLKGIRTLVTRPIDFSQEVVAAIMAKYGFAYALPMQRCVLLDKNIIIKQIPTRQIIDYIIVTSRFAAMHAIKVLKQHWRGFALVKQWYCLSVTTALELKKLGINAMYPNDGVTSEHLLKLLYTFANTSGKNILIIKGNDGRKFLQESLVLNQAQVTPIEVYFRVNEKYEKQQVMAILDRYKCNSIVCGNSEAIIQLRDFISDDRCNNYMLLVPTKRQVELANDLGFHNACYANGIDKNKIIDKLNAIKSTILRLPNGQE